MDRQKVIELARQACDQAPREDWNSTAWVFGDDALERFAALIEREVRVDAEPVAWMSPKKERLEFSRADTVYGSHTIPLYTHPAPAVDAESVGFDVFIKDGRVKFRIGNRQFTIEYPTEDKDDLIFIQNMLASALGKLASRPAPAASAESVASVHIKDGCLIGSQRKSGVDIPDGQYALYPIGTSPAPAVGAEPVAWMYTLEYGDTVADRKISLYQLNYPFGVCGADYLRENSDGMSYVRQTRLYTHPQPAVVRQLVEALETLVGWEEAEAEHFDAEAPDDWIMDKARRALALAKENGL